MCERRDKDAIANKKGDASGFGNQTPPNELMYRAAYQTPPNAGAYASNGS
jgi:hypothetical protein